MSRSWKTAATLLGAAAAGTVVFDRAIELDIGMLPGERHKPLPGDDILPGATVSFDRAITIQAPPEKVWPWLIQLGQDRAGFYSFTSLENLVGCNVTDSHNIMPAWQERRIGVEVPLHPDIALSVVGIDPGSSLVLSSDVGGHRARWTSRSPGCSHSSRKAKPPAYTSASATGRTRMLRRRWSRGLVS